MQLWNIILLFCFVLQQVEAFPRGGGGRGGGGRGGGGRGGGRFGGRGGRFGGGGGGGYRRGRSGVKVRPPSWPSWITLRGGWTYTTARDFTSGSSSWR